MIGRCACGLEPKRTTSRVASGVAARSQSVGRPKISKIIRAPNERLRAAQKTVDVKWLLLPAVTTSTTTLFSFMSPRRIEPGKRSAPCSPFAKGAGTEATTLNGRSASSRFSCPPMPAGCSRCRSTGRWCASLWAHRLLLSLGEFEATLVKGSFIAVLALPGARHRSAMGRTRLPAEARGLQAVARI